MMNHSRNYLKHLSNEFNFYKEKHSITIAFHIILSKIYLGITNRLCRFVALFFTLIILLIRPWKKIVLVRLYGSQVGPYAITTEIMLNCQKANVLKTDKKIIYVYFNSPIDLSYFKNRFFYSRKYPICNKQLHKMWKRTIPIIPFYYLANCVDRQLCRILGDKYSKNPYRVHTESEFTFQLNNYEMLENENTHLRFNAIEKKSGQMMLRTMGIQQPYICLYVRDDQYFHQRRYNDENSCFRDADINNYKKAALYLAEAGYYVIRMGSAVKKSLIAAHPKIIDYATSNFRSDFMDIYLSAHCEFFISTGAGIDSIAQVFRKPMLFTNILFPCITMLHSVKLYIFKKVFNTITNEYVTFIELYHLLHLLSWDVIVYNTLCKRNMILIENTEDEILEAVKEMLLYLNGKLQHTDNDELHEIQNALTHILRKAFCLTSEKTYPTCSSSFLIKHKNMILT